MVDSVTCHNEDIIRDNDALRKRLKDLQEKRSRRDRRRRKRREAHGGR